MQKLKLNLEGLAIHNSNVLELRDVSFSIAKAMIKFIYTGSLDPEFIGHRGIDLLQAAHKVSSGYCVKIHIHQSCPYKLFLNSSMELAF